MACSAIVIGLEPTEENLEKYIDTFVTSEKDEDLDVVNYNRQIGAYYLIF